MGVVDAAGLMVREAVVLAETIIANILVEISLDVADRLISGLPHFRGEKGSA